MIYSMKYQSPIGPIMIASDGKNIIGLWNDGQKYFASGIDSEIKMNENIPELIAAGSWLDQYFAGARPDFSALPLAPRGTDFQKSVWKILMNIPYGCVVTYGEIAKKLGCKSAQAIGGAVGRNPISIIIPCHRVVGASGSLTGYAGGLDKKIRLLEHEGASMLKLHRSKHGTAI